MNHSKIHFFSQRLSFLFGSLFGAFLFFLSLTFVSAATEDVVVNATVPNICGNSTLEGAEECDDGNLANNDGCDSSCIIEVSVGPPPPPPPPPPLCGNGILEGAEQCDDGNTTSGDGCSSGCSTEAPPPLCGNGIQEGIEQCDDGNVVDGDGCSASCTIEAIQICGNNILEGTEQCDDGNTTSGDGCDASCAVELPAGVCGNNILEGIEQCDDGNTLSGDGCDASCNAELFIPEFCGNGTLEGIEQCDDGNNASGDGCSASCEVEIVFPAICGDGLVDVGEQCDDGNNASGDGCSSSCQAEIILPPPPPPPPPDGGGGPAVCGNTHREGDEQCDDGNTNDGDGCSAVCAWEPIDEEIEAAIEDIQEIILGDASIIKKTTEVVSIITQQILDVIAPRVVGQAREIAYTIGEGIQVLDELADNPVVEEVTEQIVVPAIITTAAVAIVPSLWSILIPLLRFFFLQPLLLVGRRRRKEWGVVYDSLNKRPVDLAIVRLLDAKEKTVIRSRVTDRDGRYLFSARPGEYILEVTKNGFTFPSMLLKDASVDGTMLDIYHGESIVVTDEATTVTPNIPLDPVGATKTPRRIVWERRLRVIQHILSLGGIIATVIALYISPTWYIGVFLTAHVILYALFLRHVKPHKPKGWGIVYDAHDEKPIGKAVARLFSKQYDKLVATELTDNKGRYAFLAGPSNYYITVEKKGYKEISKDITIKKSEKIVNESVHLERSDTPEIKKEKNPSKVDPPRAEKNNA